MEEISSVAAIMKWWMGNWISRISNLSFEDQDAAIAAWSKVIAGMTPPAIARAKASCLRSLPYPPDPAVFLQHGRRTDVKEQFHCAVCAACCTPPAWHSLIARTYHAARSMSDEGLSLRELDWSSPDVEIAWMAKYMTACEIEDIDPSSLIQPPEAPQQALPAPKSDRDLAQKYIEKMRLIMSAPK